MVSGHKEPSSWARMENGLAGLAAASTKAKQMAAQGIPGTARAPLPVRNQAGSVLGIN